MHDKGMYLLLPVMMGIVAGCGFDGYVSGRIDVDDGSPITFGSGVAGTSHTEGVELDMVVLRGDDDADCDQPFAPVDDGEPLLILTHERNFDITILVMAIGGQYDGRDYDGELVEYDVSDDRAAGAIVVVDDSDEEVGELRFELPFCGDITP